MAIHAPITGARSRAPSNVVRLPTASRRKVQQFHNKATRAARAALPRHPAEHLAPGQRDAIRLAGQLQQMPFLSAVAALSRMTLTVGQAIDLDFAFARLQREGR